MLLGRLQDVDSKYMGRIRSMMEALETRLIVSINDLRDWNKAIAQQLIASPLELLPAFEAAVKDVSKPPGRAGRGRGGRGG